MPYAPEPTYPSYTGTVDLIVNSHPVRHTLMINDDTMPKYEIATWDQKDVAHVRMTKEENDVNFYIDGILIAWLDFDGKLKLAYIDAVDRNRLAAKGIRFEDGHIHIEE